MEHLFSAGHLVRTYEKCQDEMPRSTWTSVTGEHFPSMPFGPAYPVLLVSHPPPNQKHWRDAPKPLSPAPLTFNQCPRLIGLLPLILLSLMIPSEGPDHLSRDNFNNHDHLSRFAPIQFSFPTVTVRVIPATGKSRRALPGRKPFCLHSTWLYLPLCPLAELS